MSVFIVGTGGDIPCQSGLEGIYFYCLCGPWCGREASAPHVPQAHEHVLESQCPVWKHGLCLAQGGTSRILFQMHFRGCVLR